MAFLCCSARPKNSKGEETSAPLVTEDVYPVHLLDQSTKPEPLLTWVMSFNDVLDPKKLHASLCRLLATDDWRKLGARIRVRQDGQLEAYAPKEYTSSIPACTFIDEKFLESNIESHPIGRAYFTLPNKRAFTQKYPIEARPHLSPPGFPPTLKEIIDGKLPSLVLHVMTFRDGTIVTVSWPSNIMDTASFKALLQNWSLVMAGKEAEVAPVFGARSDVLEKLANRAEKSEPPEDHSLSKTLMAKATWARTFKFWTKSSPRPMETRMVYIPKRIYDQFMGEIRDDVSVILKRMEEKPAVCDADIILAWMSKLHVAADAKPRNLLASVMTNLRTRLSPIRDPSGEYLQNMTLAAYSSLSQEDARDTVAEITLQYKRNMANQLTESELLTYTRHLLEKKKKSGKLPLPANDDPSAIRLVFDNIAPLHLFSAAKFEPAVLRKGDFNVPRCNPSGTMTTAHCLALNSSASESACSVLGRDCGGNFWMSCQLTKEVWVMVEDELYRLQKGVNSPVSGNSARFADWTRK